MFIVYCQSQKKTGKFVYGWSNFRIDAFQAHEILEQHKAATKAVEGPEVKKYGSHNIVTKKLLKVMIRKTLPCDQHLDVSCYSVFLNVWLYEGVEWLFQLLTSRNGL